MMGSDDFVLKDAEIAMLRGRWKQTTVMHFLNMHAHCVDALGHVTALKR
jgi:hypothetical protein